MVIKLDISKAYDRVEWDFLWHIMLKLGIDTQWVHLAMETMIVASYLMLINGELKGFVTPSKTRKSFIPILVSTMCGGSLVFDWKGSDITKSSWYSIMYKWGMYL